MRKLPLVVVEWNDTFTHTKWFPEEEAHNLKLSATFSVGWKLKSDRKTVRLTPMKDDVNCCDIQVIPRACITKIRRLE